MTWKKGSSGNPKGRPKVTNPILQDSIDRNKNALKMLILQYLNLTEAQAAERQRMRDIPLVEKMLGQVIEKITIDGDVFKMRMLLEIVFGKIPQESSPPHPLLQPRPLRHLTDEELDEL